jgi:hypothetical protein
MLMPQKTGGGGNYNFIFFLNHVLRKTKRTPGKHYGENPYHFPSQYLITKIFKLQDHLNYEFCW